MPIYEYYCADNHTVYQFYAKTLAQGKLTPRCPDNPKFKLRKLVSAFAVAKGGKGEEGLAPQAGSETGDSAEDAKMEAAMGAMEKEFSSVDENDPRAMGRMMRKMAEMTGEKMEGEMEEVVRKLEEGADPESLDAQLAGGEQADGEGGMGEGPAGKAGDVKETKHRFKARRPLRRDPKLYDYE